MLSWQDEDEIELLQTCSAHDILTHDQDENEDNVAQAKNISAKVIAQEMKGKTNIA